MTRQLRDPRVQELLADSALAGLSEADRRELAELGAEEDATYELAAAAVDLATLKVEAMPANLEARLGANAGTQAQVSMVVPRRGTSSALPWALAAACALLAAGGWWAYATKTVPTKVVEVRTPAPPPPVAPQPTLVEQRDALLRTAADVRSFAWSPTKDPAGVGVAGDVVWSESEQRGFMRFRGLAANDATRSEYQLWVFDAAQDHPIDGGVFDVTSDGEVIVPIHAKLRVAQPTLFAVTIEKPGGVVVSKKAHIVAVASVKG